MDDARVVMAAAGSERAALIGDAEGGPMAMLFAATYPERTRALVLVNTFARMLRAEDYPIDMPESAAEHLLELWEPGWGRPVALQLTAPSAAGDPPTEVASAVRSLGIEIRAGLHTGEIEVQDGDVGGIAVHIAARVMAATGDGQVLVSGTVKDLVVGSGIEFADLGEHALRGVPGTWRLHEVPALP
jgi:class 3 adenylate cyclase